MKTKRYTLETLETHITESHLDAVGGHPFDSQWIGDVLAVATVDESGFEPTLRTYTKEYLQKWLDAANELWLEEQESDEDDRMDDDEIFIESMPGEKEVAE